MSNFAWTTDGVLTVPASKGKMLLVSLGAILFVAGSIFVLLRGDAPLFVIIISILSLLFFGAIAISSFRKLFVSLSYGLKIDDRGVDDRSSGVSVGFIPWEQIKYYKITQVQSTRFILIFVENPNQLINQFSGLTKQLLRANHKTYGTPISISVVGLQCNFKTLERIIGEAFERYA